MSRVYESWIKEWRAPLVRALYQRDRAGWQDLMARAKKAQAHLDERSEFNADERQAIGIELGFLEQQGRRVFEPNERSRQRIYQQALKDLAVRPSGPESAQALHYFNLILRCGGQRLGYNRISAEDFERMFEAIPPEDRDNQFWHHVVSWAFDNHSLRHLEQAYEVQLTSPASFAGDFDWQRTNLMYLLTLNKAKELDVEEFIKRMSAYPHLVEFRDFLWPRIQAARLSSDMLWGLYEEKAMEIESRPPQAPAGEAATRSARSQHIRP